ncbi:hypothetical protein PHYPSEUDO_007773 [Phytophthora pseudosyringae]|uniref:Uncharacterized protein n=1 Tax=Phytophthora pseudosyringae TaxID=221518 RepID=A0A8T1VIU3_9STRA|nr:hypothetical protein PHYPSEUDO_007773 [Phytophthora pseudosyringae]
MRGSTNVSGWLIKPVTNMVVGNVTFSMTRILYCFEIKRLKQMACEWRCRKPTRQTSVGDDTSCSVCQRERKSCFDGVQFVSCLVCGHVACSRYRSNKQIFVTSNVGLQGKLVKVPVRHLHHDGQHQLLRAAVPAQQKSGSGEEMPFQPMHLSDRRIRRFLELFRVEQ